jgi:hypothetical protein
MSEHQHASVEFEENKRERVEYRSLKEAIEQKKKGVELIISYTK